LKARRGVLLAAGGVLLLGLLMLAAAVATLAEREAEFPEGSGAALVQEYELAIAGGDWAGAYALLSDELQRACPLEENVPMRDPSSREARVTLQGTELIGDTLIVTVRVTESEFEGPFAADQWTHERRYSLVGGNGAWRFSEYPPPFYGCPDPPADLEPAVPPPPP
jgi:hypothetical protein